MILNQSRLQVYMDCPRKFYWQYVENLVTDRPQVNLEIGSAVHEGLAVLSSEAAKGTQPEQALQIALAATQERYGRDLPPPTLPGDAEFLEEGRTKSAELVQAYYMHYGPETPWKPLGLEVAGTVEVGTGTGNFIRFRLDQLAQFQRDIFVVDHKTAGKLDPRDLLKYEIDLQMTAYIYAATKILGKQVRGVIVDIIVKTKIPQFHYEIFTRTEEDFAEFEHDWNDWCNKIKGDNERLEVILEQGKPARYAFPKNTKECFRFGTCPYRPLCVKDTPGTRNAYVRRKEDYVDNETLLKPARSSAG